MGISSLAISRGLASFLSKIKPMIIQQKIDLWRVLEPLFLTPVGVVIGAENEDPTLSDPTNLKTLKQAILETQTIHTDNSRIAKR